MKIIIIGGGQVGAYIAGLLVNQNNEITVIENRENAIAKLKTRIPAECVYAGNGTEPNALEACGIAKADVVAAVTGADETNLVASTMSKFEFNVPRVIARVNNPRNVWLFNKGMGVDYALNQADIMAHLVVQEMDFKNMLTLMKLNKGENSIVRIKVEAGSAASGKTVAELSIPGNSLLINVHRGKQSIIPNGATKIAPGDEILAFTNSANEAVVNKIFASRP